MKDRAIFWLTAGGVAFWLIALNHVAFWEMVRGIEKFFGEIF
jgi:hypothetical protein